MKAWYKMCLSARNLAKTFILLFVVFQVFTVIVTLERYTKKGNVSPAEIFSRGGIALEDSTVSTERKGNDTSKDGSPVKGRSPDEREEKEKNDTNSSTELPENSRKESLPEMLGKLVLEKLRLISETTEETSEASEINTGVSDSTPFKSSSPDDETEDEPTESTQKNHHHVPSEKTELKTSAPTATTEEATRYTKDELLVPTSTAKSSTDEPETDVHYTITTPRAESTTKNEGGNKKRRGFSLINLFLKMVQFVANIIEPNFYDENPEVTTEAFSFKGLLAFSSEYDTVGVIRSAGYPAETHKVKTADGYILTVHRIPPRPPLMRPARAQYLPVFLQHGLWSSSYQWFEDKPQYTLPFLLADKGYDVWLGNSRGNIISQEHVSLPIDTNSSYWDFSFHEMGIYDLPAVIEHVLATTNKPQLHYIGHSMGTTMFFVMASLRPDIAQKVHFMMALAPIATVGPIRSFFRWLMLIEKFILTREKPIAYLAEVGISLKTILHYMQLYVSGKFQMYDYGKIANMDIYKSTVPPSYDLARVTVPTVLCYGTKDTFLTKDDIETLEASLGNALGIWPLPLNHFQFPNGKFTKDVLYNYIPLHLH